MQRPQTALSHCHCCLMPGVLFCRLNMWSCAMQRMCLIGQISGVVGAKSPEVFEPKNTQNGNKSRLPGATCIFSKFCGDKIEEREIPQPMVKSAARVGAPKPSYGHFSHPAGHGRGKFSSRKTPKMAINRDFPGLRAFSANFARDKTEEREIPHPMVKSAARFGVPKPSYGHFSHRPPTAGGSFRAEKHPKWQ